ncbi:hypothetical protein [Bradyrhizobium prioriisuperbiae]|uniref:hypothetical protein n=1 Tax=Bradyrhizobium prioriisuperbiae TaxID=2854389 RepID=UPI0028F0888B|nr:hypothetical protein [Bradyrhizobium prioritasuperba]
MKAILDGTEMFGEDDQGFADRLTVQGAKRLDETEGFFSPQRRLVGLNLVFLVIRCHRASPPKFILNIISNNNSVDNKSAVNLAFLRPLRW